MDTASLQNWIGKPFPPPQSLKTLQDAFYLFEAVFSDTHNKQRKGVFRMDMYEQHCHMEIKTAF